MNGSPPSAAEKVAGCEDILNQIFLRTPAKSLLKFRSVCKRWRFLISAGKLTLAHTQFHRQKPAGLLLDDYILPLNPQRDESLPIFEAPCANLLNLPWNRVIQSCNGLLLVTPTVSSIKRGIGYFVCNPTTNEFNKFPPRPEPVKNKTMTISKYALAFDPPKSPHYKVICVRARAALDNAVEDTEIDIYSSETDSWRISDVSFAEPEEWNYTSPVYCNGAVHWYSFAPKSIYFNVDEEILDTYPMPECIQEDGLDVKYFGESRGRLVMILGKELDIVVFELAKDYSGWSAKYKFGLEPAKTAFPEVIESLEKNLVNVLAVVLYEEKEEDSVVVVTAGHVIFSCNLMSQELKKLSDCDCETEFLRDCMLPWDAVHPYYASFARL